MSIPADISESICTLSEFLDWINVCHDKLQPKDGVLFFRGHSIDRYKLLPSAFRSKSSRERDVVMNYRQKHFASVNYLANIEMILLDMHSHGMPTRLLAWSASPILALYYACLSDAESDGVVYCLNPKKPEEQIINSGTENCLHAEALKNARMCLAFGWSVDEISDYIKGRYGYALNRSQLDAPMPITIQNYGNKFYDKEVHFVLWGIQKSELNLFKLFSDNLVEVRIKDRYKENLKKEIERLGIMLF